MNYLVTEKQAEQADMIDKYQLNRAVFAIWGDDVVQKFDEQYGAGSWVKLEDWQRDTLMRSVRDQITNFMDVGDGVTDLILDGFEGTENDWYGSEYQLRDTFIAR